MKAEPSGGTPESWAHRPGEPDDPDRPSSQSMFQALTIEGDAAIAPRPSSGIRAIASGFISLTLHATLLVWLVHRPPIDGIGAGGQDLEAVSIEVISAAALESMSARASIAASGAAGPVAETVGVDAPPQAESAAATAAEPETKQEASPTPPPPDIVAKPNSEQEVADALAVAETSPPRTETPVETMPEEPPPEPPQDAPQEPTEKPKDKPPTPTAATASEAQAAFVTGGATSHAAAIDSIESEAAAGASPGELARYALAVRMALGRARPRHEGRKGKVVVSFRLSPDATIETTENSSFERQPGPGQRRARRRACRDLP